MQGLLDHHHVISDGVGPGVAAPQQHASGSLAAVVDEGLQRVEAETALIRYPGGLLVRMPVTKVASMAIPAERTHRSRARSMGTG